MYYISTIKIKKFEFLYTAFLNLKLLWS